MILLHIETSTNVCSVALSEDEKCIFSRENREGLNHAALLSVFINEAKAVLGERKPDAVCVSSGPGSYTGLRIGVSTAKGLCYGWEIPLIAIDTLEIMASAALKQLQDPEDTLLCPMIDARRMEVYDTFYNADKSVFRPVAADVITDGCFDEILNERPVYFFGNGSTKCKPVLSHPEAHFLDDIVPLAENMISSGATAFNEKKFVDVAYFEPFYLKEFQATAPKKQF